MSDLTVASVLNLAVCKDAQVVAGARGLDRAIRWVHIVDIPSVVEWVQAGDLLLTTAYGLRGRPDLQAQLVPALVEKGLAGLIVAVGRYVRHLPRAMRAQGDALDFPLIELPWEVPFEAVTRAVSEQIFARQVHLLTQSTQIHTTLTQLVLQGGDLPALARTLADLIGRSVTLEDATLTVLAHEERGATDPVRQESVQTGRTPARVLRVLETQGVLAALRSSARPVHVAPIPEIGLLYERIVARIVVGAETYGYAWIIAGDTPLAELDYTALEHGATVAALMLLQQRAVREAEQRLRGDLLDQLLSAAALTPLLEDQARRLNYPLAAPAHIALVVHPLPGPLGPADVLALAPLVEGALREGRLRALVAARGEAVVGLVAAGRPATSAQAAASVGATAQAHGWPVVVGVGTPEGGPGGIARSYAQAQEAVSVGLRLHAGQPGIYAFADLGLFHWLFRLGQDPAAAASNRYVALVRRLTEYDRQKGSALRLTLERYLDTGGNALATARQLYLHRNTLSQRLQKIAELCEVSLADPLERLNLQVALKFERLTAPPTGDGESSANCAL